MAATVLPIWHDRRFVPINHSSEWFKKKTQPKGSVMCSGVTIAFLDSREKFTKFMTSFPTGEWEGPSWVAEGKF